MPANGGYMYVFAVGCGKNGAICQPKWTAQLDDVYGNGSAAVTDDMVYVPGTRRLFAFPVNCRTDGGVCDPAWVSRKTGFGGGFAASPAVANGVVYIATQGKYQANGRLIAFNAYCTNATHVCRPIWRSPYLGAMVNSSPAVAHGMVFVASNNGMFYAFGLPATQ
jgi:outer membrane protein assembly factor BamB